MSIYIPDMHVFLKIELEDGDFLYKVFGTWKGGFSDGDSWRCNSGITKIEEDAEGYLEIFGSSGSFYKIHKESEGTSMYTMGILEQLIDSSDTQVTVVTLEEVKKGIEA